MKRTALVTMVALLLVLAASAASYAGTQTIDTLMGKIIENYTLSTDFGNVYFNQLDIKRMVHAAAHLRKIDLGFFTTDTGQTVRVRITRFDRGVATVLVSSN